MLRWVLAGIAISPTTESEKSFFVQSSRDEFTQMCSQEVLGLADVDDNKDSFHKDFKDRLRRLEDGTYSTRLPWKHDHPQLPSNKGLTLARLGSTTRKLERMKRLEEYHTVMEEQLAQGIIKLVPEPITGKVIHYIPNQPVIRDEAECTKMRIVYDCSAKKDLQLPSLNDCLEIGPPLQPMIFDILLRNKMNKYCVTGDIRKAFLQIKIEPADKDALRLLWYNNLEEQNIVTYRFTRVIFGSAPSPYIPGSTLQKHISQYSDKYPDTVEELLTNTYVNDVQSGGEDEDKLMKFKTEVTEIMKEGGFQLHKWHNNAPGIEELDTDTNLNSNHSDESSTYAKQAVGTKPNETKILGTAWKKDEDQLSFNLAKCLGREKEGPLTKERCCQQLTVSLTCLELFHQLS